MIAPILDGIPTCLIAQPRWMLWREVERKGKKTKEPRTARNTLASSTGPHTWAPFPEIAAVFDKQPQLFDGFGFSLGDLENGEHFAGIDFDSCLDENGDIAEWAQLIVDATGSYTETSPSGTGLKVFFRCKAGDAEAVRQAFGVSGKQWGCKRTVGLNGKDHGPAIEVYLGPGRYFTVTGRHWVTSPEDVVLLDRSALLRVAELVRNATGTVGNSQGNSDSQSNSKANGKDDSRSAIAFKLGSRLCRAGADYEQMCDGIRNHPTTAEWCREKGDAHDGRELKRIWDKVNNVLIVWPSAPLDSARELVRRHYTADTLHTLHHQQSTFYRWTGTCYAELPHEGLRATTYTFLDGAYTGDKDGDLIPFKPNQRSVTWVLDALAAAAQLPPDTKAPAWLDDATHAKPAEVLAFTNGLLHLPTRRLRPHTPLFFNLNAADYAYDSSAPPPCQWLTFLEELWPDDQQSVDTLQEIFGLGLSTDTSHQKSFLIIGPKRSGKGTIARIFTALLGKENVAGPTLSSLGERFGAQPLIGKPLAVISDARLNGRSDIGIIAERLLSISGEDAIDVDRKYSTVWHGTLPTRFLILTNELPRLTDASGALVSRFIVLRLIRSFYGQEDSALTNKLLSELTGILNWALIGYDRLRTRGHFIQPMSAAEAVRQMEDLGSPIAAFVRDRCIVRAGKTIEVSILFTAWLEWCREQNRDHPGTMQTFGKDLNAVVPGLRTARPRSEDGRRRYYEGIDLDPTK